VSLAKSAEAPHAISTSILQMITGFMTSQAIGVAAQLRVPDLLADGPKTGAALAVETQTDAASLHRLLRALASVGVVEHLGGDRFALTALGAQLRSGAPGSLRNLALMFCGERAWRSWGNLLHSVRTGASAAEHLYGMNGFEYFARFPDAGSIFNEAMAEATRQVAAALIATYDLSRFRTIVDVGGGNGALLVAVLAAFPGPRGILFDLPSGCGGARSHVEAAGLNARCQVVEGDFFEAVPEGADAYVLKAVIHDWPDDKSVAILKNCCAAIAARGKLLLIERLMPEKMDDTAVHRQVAMMDINMMVMPGGRERTESEFKLLLESAGFAHTSTRALSAGYVIIEAVRHAQ
jgi:hypothetical protein